MGKYWETGAIRAIFKSVTAQGSSKSAAKSSGFPFDDLWEEAAPPAERLYDHGIDREIIDRNFKRAEELGADYLGLTKESVRKTISELNLEGDAEERLADRLYYLAGHYYSPKFHKLFGDDPTSARVHFKSVAATAAKLQKLVSAMSASMARQFNAVRLQAHSRRRGTPFMEWSELAKELADVETAAETVAAEIPVQKRGANPKVLQGRWLRHSAEAIELATGRKIQTKTSDSSGSNYRFEGVEGAVFEAYCKAVDECLAVKTLVRAVRAYQRCGIGGSPPKSENSSN